MTQSARCEERHHLKEQDMTTEDQLTCVVQEPPSVSADRARAPIEGSGKLRSTRKFQLQIGRYVWRLSWHEMIARRVQVYGGQRTP